MSKNIECNTCIYRGERDVGTPIMPVIHIYCDYEAKNKYDVRTCIDGHCNKYEKKKYTPDCSMCCHYDNKKNDCEWWNCDFEPEQIRLDF